jgi:two-component system nitrate/nitrite response regulator NarL
MATLEVLLVDDHVLFRKGVASLLSSREDVKVVGEAGNGCEALARARETVPDLILMDVHMPECDGLDAVRAIKHEMPQVKIIMLTVDENDEILFEAVKNGAQGYLLKKLDPQQLFDTLELVARGEVALSPAMMAKVLNEFQKPVTEAGKREVRQDLTPRETDVLQLVVQGATNKEIADALSITENTVKKHLQSILSKLHLQNRIQAAVYAVRQGLMNEPSSPG